MFHAELPEAEHGEACTKSPEDYSRFLHSRPELMEDRAIELVIRLCREYQVPCHIVHLSSASALPMLRKAREEGVPISVETTFHYLFFDAENIPSGSYFFLVREVFNILL